MTPKRTVLKEKAIAYLCRRSKASIRSSNLVSNVHLPVALRLGRKAMQEGLASDSVGGIPAIRDVENSSLDGHDASDEKGSELIGYGRTALGFNSRPSLQIKIKVVMGQ